ncbi:hypothetical protein J3E73DRAFT_435189 [Bipolaris maydis]|nr:hypothetical protein J3E73DRAFT_435189 [Bipolaris maydis]
MCAVKKPRSRPPTSLRDHLPFPNSALSPLQDHTPLAAWRLKSLSNLLDLYPNIKRNGRHLLQLETVLFTLYYPASIGNEPRIETAKGYSRFAGIPSVGNSKKNGYKIKNQQGHPPEGMNGEPTFPLLCSDHGLGGSRTAYSSLCSEFCKLRHLTNNVNGVDSELRSAQIEMRLCELEEAYRVLKMICVGDGNQIAEQNLRGKGLHSGKSVLCRQDDYGCPQTYKSFTNVQAGIIYDIWGHVFSHPIFKDIHVLGEELECIMSLMKEASEHGAPAYLLTVRGSVHINQSDFSILYRHLTSFFMKATVNPERAIDLNVGTSLEFLRLKRLASGLQRKFKRNFRESASEGYTTSDEMWCFFKPTDEGLQKWIDNENKGEKRIDEDHANCAQ